MPLEECEEIVRRWRKTYPEFGWIYNSLDRKVHEDQWVWTLPVMGQVPGPLSEQSWFGPRDYPHTAWNRVVQGSLAAFNKIWLAKTEQWTAELGVPEALVLNVHDSEVLELPVSEGREIAEEIGRRGGLLATKVFTVPMKVDVGLWKKQELQETPARQASVL